MTPDAWSWVHDPLTYALVGLISFVLGVLWAVIKGKLVPAMTVATLSELWERRLKESLDREQAWKAAHDAAAKSRDELEDRVDQLTVLGETTVRLLQALPDGRRD